MHFTFASLVSLTLILSSPTVRAFPDVSVPSQCTAGFTAGSDTVLLTVPYPPAAVLDVVADFQNLTWSGNPPSTVTLNGTDNQPGTAREYSLDGLTVVETLLQYYRPPLSCRGFPNTPPPPPFPFDTTYVEAHNTAQVDYDGNNVYLPFDGLSARSTCRGNATVLNYTTQFCANDAPSAQSQLHTVHTQDLQNVQAMLGNASFSSCQDLSTQTCG